MNRPVRTLRRMTLSAVFTLSCAGSAFADPILLQTSRSIFARAQIQTSASDPDPAGAFDRSDDGTLERGAFIRGVEAQVSVRNGSASARASQNSFISADGSGWSGSGSADAAGNSGNEPDHPLFPEMNSGSVLFVALRLAEPRRYELTGAFNASGGGLAQLLVLGPSISLIGLASDGFTFDVVRRGVLMPGTYSFLAEARAGPDFFPTVIGSGAFDFDFALLPGPVPEPGSLALLGIGLIGAGLRGWRKLFSV